MKILGQVKVVVKSRGPLILTRNLIFIPENGVIFVVKGQLPAETGSNSKISNPLIPRTIVADENIKNGKLKMPTSGFVIFEP